MTGPEHYTAAEQLLEVVDRRIGNTSTYLLPPDARSRLTAQAQVHATLALAGWTVTGLTLITAAISE
jgi:hypothetical protein